MTQAISSLASYYQNQASAIDAQVASLQSQISNGVAALASTPQTQESTTLSQKGSSASTAKSSIQNGQSLIAVAQTGLNSINTILDQMRSLAAQASSSQIGTGDSISLNTRFQSLYAQLGKTANSASINGYNLLSGTLGYTATTAAANGKPGSSWHINPINIYQFMTAGLLSNIAIDTPANAQAALSQIMGTKVQISNGQYSLRVNSSKLTQMAGTTTSATAPTNTTSNVTQDTIKQLQAQVAQLQTLSKINYNLASQLSSSASSNLSQP